MSASSTFIPCSSAMDAQRLATILSSAATWAGNTPPDQIFPNNSQVELTWNTVSVSHPAPIIAKVVTNIATSTITHRNTSGTTTAKL